MKFLDSYTFFSDATSTADCGDSWTKPNDKILNLTNIFPSAVVSVEILNLYFKQTNPDNSVRNDLKQMILFWQI